MQCSGAGGGRPQQRRGGILEDVKLYLRAFNQVEAFFFLLFFATLHLSIGRVGDIFRPGFLFA